MVHWGVTLLVIAVLAAVLGFGGLLDNSAALAKLCFFVFLILSTAAFAFGRRSI
jgi:uncharacterized membrane protein YtjA (UPF0391 family)